MQGATRQRTGGPLDRLLVLSDERIAAELRRIAELDAMERRFRRRQLGAIASAGAAYLAGMGVVGASWHVTDPDRGQILFWLGLLVAIGGPTAIGYWWWLREQSWGVTSELLQTTLCVR
jgi:hypothetical protein